MTNNLKPLIVILGPTASGKSELAIELAKKFNGEIVSCDSRQIYREMNIGTAKVTEEEMQGIPHHMLDIVNPDEEFTLPQFKKLAVKHIQDIQERDKIPFLVGGTMLYIQSIVDNLQIPEVKPNKELRDELESKTNQELYDQLEKIDPDALKVINLNNKRRLIRALEVCLTTDKKFSKQKLKGSALFNILQIGLKPDDKILEEKINNRANKMIKAGLLEEVKGLIKKYGSKPHSMDSIGYQEIIPYLEGKISLDEAKELIKIHTRQYFKRQMSWFKRDKRINWLEDHKKAEELVQNFLL